MLLLSDDALPVGEDDELDFVTTPYVPRGSSEAGSVDFMDTTGETFDTGLDTTIESILEADEPLKPFLDDDELEFEAAPKPPSPVATKSPSPPIRAVAQLNLPALKPTQPTPGPSKARPRSMPAAQPRYGVRRSIQQPHEKLLVSIFTEADKCEKLGQWSKAITYYKIAQQPQYHASKDKLEAHIRRCRNNLKK